jgi:hypothetical protein
MTFRPSPCFRSRGKYEFTTDVLWIGFISLDSEVPHEVFPLWRNATLGHEDRLHGECYICVRFGTYKCPV